MSSQSPKFSLVTYGTQINFNEYIGAPQGFNHDIPIEALADYNGKDYVSAIRVKNVDSVLTIEYSDGNSYTKVFDNQTGWLYQEAKNITIICDYPCKDREEYNFFVDNTDIGADGFGKVEIHESYEKGESITFIPKPNFPIDSGADLLLDIDATTSYDSHTKVKQIELIESGGTIAVFYSEQRKNVNGKPNKSYNPVKVFEDNGSNKEWIYEDARTVKLDSGLNIYNYNNNDALTLFNYLHTNYMGEVDVGKLPWET